MKEIVLYGFGGLGIKFYNYLLTKDFRIISILDKGKSGQVFSNMKILNPETYNNKSTPVVISILNEYANLDQIKDYLYALGYQQVYTVFEAIQEFDFIDFEHLFIKHPVIFDQDQVKNKIKYVRNLLSDELSKQIIDALVMFRKTFDYYVINNFYDDSMYLPEPVVSLVNKLDYINIIDCGACHGDLIDIFNQKKLKINNYYAFEPDGENISKLKSKILNSKVSSCIFPMGVGNFNGLIGFNTGHGTGCNIDENADNKILVTKVDDVILCNVNFVKMDIEGFENEALEGMQELLAKNKPILAISIYHKPLDFLDIPLSLSRQHINNYLSEYTENLGSILSSMQYEKFYFRYHGRFGFEFVLYAI